MSVLHALSLAATFAVASGALTIIARDVRANAARCIVLLATHPTRKPAA
jgi:hypothetical protein